jgi:hypothetical protein
VRWLKALDDVLRGEATRPDRLRDQQLDVPAGGLVVVGVVLGMVYGFFMGWYALVNRQPAEFGQVLATMVKVPALFFLTLLVTMPSLYVFNALVGSRLSLLAMIRLLIAALAVTLAVLASFGPIVAFFSITTTSYHFMVLLNVLIFTVAGILGLLFLLQTLRRLAPVQPARPAPSPPAVASTPGEPPMVLAVEAAGALDRLQPREPVRGVRAVFLCWIVVFALVGAQMSWVLRPFIGSPDEPFTLFRPRASHFFEATWHTLVRLFS